VPIPALAVARCGFGRGIEVLRDLQERVRIEAKQRRSGPVDCTLTTSTPSSTRLRAGCNPDQLAPHLARVAKGRLPRAPLFEPAATRPRPQDWAREQVWRLCKLAGVPPVTPQGLRGTLATPTHWGGAKLSPETFSVNRVSGGRSAATGSGAYFRNSPLLAGLSCGANGRTRTDTVLPTGT
jgi:hypothetical protein